MRHIKVGSAWSERSSRLYLEYTRSCFVFKRDVDHNFVKSIRVVTTPLCRYMRGMKNAIKRWRESVNITQEQAARRLGITLRNYQNYESGAYEPPISVRMLMTAVSTGLDLHPYELADAEHSN